MINMINMIKQNIKETWNHHGKLLKYNATSVRSTHVKDCGFGIEWSDISHALAGFFARVSLWNFANVTVMSTVDSS
jgi:hypothetical protein